MKSRFVWGGGSLFVLGVLLLALQMRPRAVGEERPNPKPSADSANVKPTEIPTPLNESVTRPDTDSNMRLTGTVVAGTKAVLSTRVPARIVSVPVTEGQAVGAQSLLVLLDDSDLVAQERTATEAVNTALAQKSRAVEGKKAQIVKADAEIVTAQAGRRIAEVKLQQANIAREALNADIETEKRLAEDGIKKAEEALKVAKRTRQSLEALAKVGGVARNDLEAARNQERIASADLNTARTQRERLNAGASPNLSYRLSLADKDRDSAQEGLRQSEEAIQSAKRGRASVMATADQEIVAAEAGVKQARTVVKGLQEARSALRLVAPFSGIVTGLQARVGETAQPGLPLLTLLSTTGVRIEALVTARHLAQLRVGRRGKVQFDTLPNKTLAVVVKELPVVSEPDGRTFRVKFDLLEGGSVLPGQVAHLQF